MDDRIDQQSSNVQLIQCRSHKAASNVTRAINEEIERIVEQNSDLTEQEKERYKQRFHEIYDTTFYKNIEIDGKDCSSQNHEDKSEFEPCDKEKRAMIDLEIFPRLDNAILSTAKKRKHTSSLCNSKAIDLSNLALSHMVELKIVKEEKLPTNDVHENQLLLDQSHMDRLYSSSCCLASLTKSLPLTVDKSTRLKKAKQMHSEMEKSSMDNSGSDINVLNKRKLDGTTSNTSLEHVCPHSSSHLKFQCVVKEN